MQAPADAGWLFLIAVQENQAFFAHWDYETVDTFVEKENLQQRADAGIVVDNLGKEPDPVQAVQAFLLVAVPSPVAVVDAALLFLIQMILEKRCIPPLVGNVAVVHQENADIDLASVFVVVQASSVLSGRMVSVSVVAVVVPQYNLVCGHVVLFADKTSANVAVPDLDAVQVAVALQLSVDDSEQAVGNVVQDSVALAAQADVAVE